MSEVPSNLIPTRITQLDYAPVASEDSLLYVVYEGSSYKIRAGDLLAVAGVPTTRQVIAGTGLTGGGPLSNDVTLSIAVGGVGSAQLANTGVTPGVYGDTNNVPVLTVDETGRVVAATTVSVAGSGTVTSVGLSLPSEFTVTNSPVTTSGTLTATWANPVSVNHGGTGVDASAATNGSILIGNGSGFSLNTLTAGSNISITNTSGNIQINAIGGGTVTSVGLALPSEFIVTNSPVTGSGTLTASWANPVSVDHGGTGFGTYSVGDMLYASGTSAFSKISAGSNGQVLTLSAGVPTWATFSGGVTSFQTSLNGLTPSTSSTGAVTLAGTLGPVSGGTGLSTYSTGDLLYASTTNTLSKLSAGTNGYVLTMSGGVPTWAASTGGVTSFQTSLSGLTPSISTTGSVTLAGTLGPTSGGTGVSSYTTGDILYASASNTLSKLPVGSNGQVLTLSSGVPSWAAAAGNVTISNDTTTGTFEYPLFASSTSGTVSTVYTGNSNLLYKPSTGELQAQELTANNGLILNASTISSNFTVGSGYNVMSVGPITTAPGVAVTVAPGQRWVVL